MRNPGPEQVVYGARVRVGQLPAPDRRWYVFRHDPLSGTWVTDTRRGYDFRTEAQEVVDLLATRASGTVKPDPIPRSRVALDTKTRYSERPA